MSGHSVEELLLVEDDPIDVQIFRKAAARVGMSLPIEVAGTGEAALRHLAARHEQSGCNASLVVTDINMPGLTGHELMEDLRKDERLRSALVFVLSTSDQKTDIAQAYGNGAAGYIVKKPGSAQAEATARLLQAYCETISLP